MSQQDNTREKKKHVVVIGAGVIGLSTALLLLEANHAVTIIAEHLPAPFETIHPQEQIDYSSPWAGAHNRFIPPPPPPPSPAQNETPQSQTQAHREHALALRTYHRMKSLSNPNLDPQASQFSSIKFMKGVEFLESPGEEYLSLSEERAASSELGIENFRVLSPGEFPPDGRVKWGCEYTTWCVNPMVYCCFLLRRFVNRGGMILKRRLRSPGEAFQLSFPVHSSGEGRGIRDSDWNRHFGAGWLVPKDCTTTAGGEEKVGIPKEKLKAKVDAVVNASGNGFGDDPNMFITRGQTCVVAETGTDNGQEPMTVTRQNADGTWTFTVPRGAEGGTIVGGTREPDNYDPLPCPRLREQLLERIVATQPGLLAQGKTKLTPVRDIVGRRPTRRGGPRIEGEVLKVGDKDGFVMHAYGMGGRGFELSWGVAEEVVNGVQKYFLDVEQKGGKRVSKL